MESDITIVLKTAHLPNRLSLPKPLGLLNTLSDFKDLFCPTFQMNKKNLRELKELPPKDSKLIMDNGLKSCFCFTSQWPKRHVGTNPNVRTAIARCVTHVFIITETNSAQQSLRIYRTCVW